MPLQREVIQFIRRENLVQASDTVIIGVSGGTDSLCLLHLLHTCRNELGIVLHAAHLNHGIRGADADADAQFVAEFAARYDISCTIEKRDVPAVAREHKLALEEAARCVRYAFLLDIAQRARAPRIAVAHNADDQSETVLMHWLRGAGLAGLRGMLPATRMADLRLITRSERGNDAGNDIWLVRPLLQTPRVEIERYCHEHSLTPRFDRSNLDTTLFRNKLRHELLPHLEQEYRPNFREILRRSAQVIRDDYDLLCRQRDEAWAHIAIEVSEQAIVLDKAGWQMLHPSLQRSTIRHAVQCLRMDIKHLRRLRDVNFEHVEMAAEVARKGHVGAQATLPCSIVMTVGYTSLIVADQDFVPRPDFAALTVDSLPLALPGITRLPGSGHVHTELIAKDQLPVGWEKNDDPWQAFLDADVAGCPLFLRRRRTGDRFFPLGMGGKRKLVSEMLVNERVPAWWRDQVPLLVREDGEILWVCGWRIDERARVNTSTCRVAVVQLSPTIIEMKRNV